MDAPNIAQDNYLENAQGHLVPLDRVQPIDLARHELVQELIGKGKTIQQHMQSAKKSFMADVAAFCSMSADQYGVTYGGSKGNVTLLSYDGKYKISRAMAESITFDERLQAARELINQCLRDWTEGSPTELQSIIDNAFQVDKEGNISTGRILSLRRLNISDERWKNAMQAISDSIQVTGSKAYIRMYERDSSGKYQPISLDMAAV